MSYTALVVVFVLVCAACGAIGGPRLTRPWVTAGFAAAMVLAQFAVLMSK